MKTTKKISLALGLALTTGVATAGESYRLYNVVPMYLGHEREQAAKCVEMYERTGEDLALYSLTLHPEGRPATDKLERYVASYRAFAGALKGTKVRAGILVQAILGHWPRTDKDIEPWMRTIDQDGKTVRFCPLDPGFAAYIDAVFTALAKERPAFILTDDDVRAFSHGCECFCERHVKLFNSRRGTSYDSDALRAAVAKGKPGDADYDAFFALQREMMENDVVGRIRRAIDAVDPTIPAGVCIAGEEHRLCAPLARRIAAKGQVPVMRCSTGLYGERMEAGGFPRIYLRMQGFADAYRGSGIELLDEADTCPQNLWSKSARSFMTHLVASAFTGLKGAKTWYVNGIRATGIPVSAAYTDVLAKNRGLLDVLAREVDGTSFAGVAVPSFVEANGWHLFHNHEDFFVRGGTACTAVVPFGVPYCASSEFGDPRFVFVLGDKSEVDHLSDADLKRLFSGRVLVLRDAALALARRGRADYLGATAERTEKLFNAEWDVMNGASMNFSPAMDGSVALRCQTGCETLSELVFRPYAGAKREHVSPASVFFRNALGGRVVTSVYHGQMMRLHQYSEARKRWLVSCVDRLSDGTKLAVCGNDQDVLLSERRGADGTRIVLAVNLNSDPIAKLSLRLPSGSSVEALSADGTWRPVAQTVCGEFTDLDLPLGFYEAGVVRILPPVAVEFRECPKCDRRIRIDRAAKRAYVNVSRLDGADREAVAARARKLLARATISSPTDPLLRPTMGWSSWNCFGVGISEERILSVAEAMATNGLKAAGYTYVNIDDGFFWGRAADGTLRIHPKRFPNGLKPVVDGIHARGLKAGIYSDAGADTCGSMWGDGATGKDKGGVGAGLYGHDAADCRMHFNDLGFDFIKVDFCGGKALKLDECVRYTEIAKAIRATGRTDVRFNICRWAFPGTWAADVAGSWRTTGDIRASWKSIRGIVEENLYLSAYASPGHYNDMDMLEVGQLKGLVKSTFGKSDTGLTQDEETAHFGLWCMMSSPLLIGCDVRTIPVETLKLVTNPYLLAMSQNDLGLQAMVAQRDGDACVLVKDADVRFGPSRYVAFYNPDGTAREMSVRAETLDLGGRIEAFDLVDESDPGPFEDEVTVSVPPHAAKFYLFEAERRLPRTVYEAESAYLGAYQELKEGDDVWTARPCADKSASGGRVVRRLGGSAANDLVWPEVESVADGEHELLFSCAAVEDLVMDVQVDSDAVRRVSVPATAGAFAEVRVTVPLKRGLHRVRLFRADGPAPDVDCMRVRSMGN